MIYINKDAYKIYVELDQELDPESNFIGTTWEDYKQGAWILLSMAQLSFRDTNPNASVKEVFDMKLVEPVEPTPEELLSKAKSLKIEQIKEKDSESNVFYIQVSGRQSMPMWLDKNTRASLLSMTIPAEKEAGKSTTTLWYEGTPPVPVEVPITWMEENLPKLELYAKKTYDLMNSNIASVYSCTTIEEVDLIDINSDYPDPEVFIL